MTGSSRMRLPVAWKTALAIAGATPTTAMSHVAVQEKLNGSPVDWMEKVTDEQYRK